MAKKKKPDLAKHSEIVAEIKRYFENSARQTDGFKSKEEAYEMLKHVTSEMLSRTERRVIEIEREAGV